MLSRQAVFRAPTPIKYRKRCFSGTKKYRLINFKIKGVYFVVFSSRSPTDYVHARKVKYIWFPEMTTHLTLNQERFSAT